MGKSVQSLYKKIEAALKDGCLPPDFSLPESTDSGIQFADGARDGILLYHMNLPRLSDADRSAMEKGISQSSEHRWEEAEAALMPVLEKYRALGVIDEMQSWIMNHARDLNAENLFLFGMKQLQEADETEMVKLGLSILELFDTEEEEDLKRMVRTVGRSDEFTLFAVFIMKKWKNADREIFDLAKSVTGWGRIHALERLEAEDEEIRRWILMEGVRNDILPSYSALAAWRKSGAEEVLRLGPDASEFAAIKRIISALMDEGPMPGLSALENREEIIRRFLSHAGNYAMTAEDCDIIRELRSRFIENEEIRLQCDGLLEKPASEEASLKRAE